MDIRIKTTDYELTKETREYLDDRIASLEKFLREGASSARCEIELGRAGGGQRHGANMWFAEIRIMSPGSPPVYAHNSAPTVNAAIDDVKEEIERQLRREKKFHIRVMRKTGSAIKNWMRFGQ